MNRKLFGSLNKSYCNYVFLAKNGYSYSHKYANSKPNLNFINSCLPTRPSILYSTHKHTIALYEEVWKIGKGGHKNVLIVDVREPEELSETGCLPSSINIPLGNLEAVLKDMPDQEFLKTYGREKPNTNSLIIFSCKLGKRSATACEISQQLGFTNVKNYLGGWMEWEERSQTNLNKQEVSCNPNSEQYPQISYEEVRRLKDDANYLLIDVREPSELQEHGSIPGAINIPLDDLENVLINVPASEFKRKYGRDKPEKNFNIIFSCRSGRRSQLAQEKAIALGFKNSINYSGSWLDWEEHTKNVS